MLESCEKEYRGTLVRLGGSMLVLLALFNVLMPLEMLLSAILEVRLDAVSYYIVDQLLYGLTYMAIFLVPAGFFYLISRRRETQPIPTSVRLGRDFPLVLVAAVALVLGAAYLNAYALLPVHFSDFIEAATASEPLDTNYKLVLAIIITALIPAFVEELLFRGVVLTNLLPYGRAPAVVISAVLFGLMHQNPGQMLYATMAGLALGLVCVRTRSIWGGVLIHFVNNLFSVFEQLLQDRLDAALANELCIYAEGAIFIGGAVCAIILIFRERGRRRDLSASGFGVELEPDEHYIERPLRRGATARHFFNPTITAFMVIACLEMLYYIILSLIYWNGGI